MGPVYEGHIGFNARESVLLEELLPLWNARVEVRVKTWFEARERYWLKIKPVPNVEGLGVFNGPLFVLPRGVIFAQYGGFLIKNDAIPGSVYDHDVRMVCDYSMRARDKLIDAFINGDPSLVEFPVFAARLNHSCRPNCVSATENVYVTSGARGLTLSLVYFRTLRAIGRGEELTIDYGRNYVMRGQVGGDYVQCQCNGGHCPFRRVVFRH